MKNLFILFKMSVLSLIVSVSNSSPKNSVNNAGSSDISKEQIEIDNSIKSENNSETNLKTTEPDVTDITLSFVGDCTLGSDDNFGYNVAHLIK